ncbi:MAG TPA: hybrid sensor histidine kinase/response regulator [Kofleriaceae bacterium]|nr:hybrid sensor histidine kinase/response regulator [Kofleriaceae bacterium]
MTDHSRQVLVWAPRGRDATLAVQLMGRHGFEARAISGIEELVASLPDAGCAVITVDVLTEPVREVLHRALAAQPPWSDFPIVLFGPRGVDRADQVLATMQALGNVSIVERPVSIGTLLSALMAALRARQRQYAARDAIHQRDQFLAMLGHELRNPLAAIVLAIENMPPCDGQTGHRQPDDKQRAIIDRQARHLTRLVDDLLDVARVTSGKVQLHAQPLDIDEVLQRCLQGAEFAACSRQIELRSRLSHAGLIVEADATRLEEIFNNLIANALKYSGAGARITVGSRRDGPRCIVEIADTGIGLAADMLERVFDLFAQADASLHRSQGGLGIGLTLVRALVELHSGSIRATSEGIGRGSTFVVTLPLSHRAVAPEQARPAVVDGSTERRRVLLVDDNQDILEMTQEMLESAGYEVETAADGPEAIAQLIAAPPDVAFVDIGLPVIDGYAVADRARAAGVRSYLVAVSGYGQPDDKRRALAAGFDLHLTKPVPGAQLLATVRNAVIRPRGHAAPG